MNWVAVSWNSADPIITLNGPITASEYGDFLGKLVHPVVQMCPKNDSSSQCDNSPIHTARSVHSWF